LFKTRETPNRNKVEITSRIKMIDTGWKDFNRMDDQTNDMPQKSMAASG
jgi:hypothetical protein